MEDLFNLVKEYGFIVRTNKFDGQASWEEMQKLLLTIIHCDGLVWTIKLVKLDREPITSIENTYNYVRVVLGMKGDSKDPRDENWEKFHFFLQLVRIPNNNPACNLVKLAQIAYNLGQLSAVYDDSVYTPEVKQFYEMNDLGVMRTYTQSSCDISAEDLQKIRELIKSKSKKVGSGYLHKYLKYKKKYLQLKK
jgi:hypothetical protein